MLSYFFHNQYPRVLLQMENHKYPPLTTLLPLTAADLFHSCFMQEQQLSRSLADLSTTQSQLAAKKEEMAAEKEWLAEQQRQLAIEQQAVANFRWGGVIVIDTGSVEV